MQQKSTPLFMSRFLAEGETRLSATLQSFALWFRNFRLLQSVKSCRLLFEVMALRFFC